MTHEDEPATLPLPTTSARGNRANWFFGLLVAGLGATVVSLAMSVVVLAESVQASARLERDWQAETIQQEKLKLARKLEARQLTENLLRLREFSRTLDKIGAE